MAAQSVLMSAVDDLFRAGARYRWDDGSRCEVSLVPAGRVGLPTGAIAADDPAPQETVEVPIMDELGIFTGEFALNMAAARETLEDFVRMAT